MRTSDNSNVSYLNFYNVYFYLLVNDTHIYLKTTPFGLIYD